MFRGTPCIFKVLQVESDYMFALFIQNQEDGRKASSSGARRQEQDLEVGKPIL